MSTILFVFEILFMLAAVPLMFLSFAQYVDGTWFIVAAVGALVLHWLKGKAENEELQRKLDKDKAVALRKRKSVEEILEKWKDS